MANCATCGTQLVQKPRSRLLVAGIMVVIAGCASTMVLPMWLQPTVVLPVLVGAYLIQWAARGKGLWCRTCKKFPMSR